MEKEQDEIAAQNPCEYCEEGGKLVEADAGNCDNCGMNCCGSCMTGSTICDACIEYGASEDDEE